MKKKESKKNIPTFIEKDNGDIEEIVSVIFLREYIGHYGIFHKGQKYDLTRAIYDIFHNDCKIVEE